MSKKLTYEYVKNFIEVESKSYCLLISKEYINSHSNLIMQCKCGNQFVTTFDSFRNQNKRQCNLCTAKTLQDKYKLNYKDIVKTINSLGFTLLDDEYINSKTKMTLMDSDGYYYTSRFDNLRNMDMPEAFHPSNKYTIKNIQHWLNKNNKEFKLLSNTYQNNSNLMQWQCLNKNCNEIFFSDWKHIRIGNGCPYCAGQQVGLSNCLATKNPELVKEWLGTKNKVTPYEVTASSGKSVWWKCKNCGYEWKARISSRNTGSGCPQCNQSHGEKEISRVFDTNNIFYKPQKQFDGLVGLGGGNLSYDFYLPDFNLLIEFQGRQHKCFVKGMHTSKKDFAKQLEHDKRKREYAYNHNIKLLELWYWDFDNIEEILTRELNLML